MLVQSKAQRRQLSGPRKTHKHKGTFFGNGVRRFTDGFRPQGHLPRLIAGGFGPVCSAIRDPRKNPLCAIPFVSDSHNTTLYFSFDGGTKNATKWHFHWCPGRMLGVFRTICRAGPVWRGLGARFGRKTTENRPKLKNIV